jgi:hypothetical protein
LHASSSTGLVAAEERLQSTAGVLPRELGLRDLLLAQTLYVIIPEFFGTAAKAGASHVVLWIIVLSVFPIIDVQSSWQYSVKTAAVILGANLVGVLLYHVENEISRSARAGVTAAALLENQAHAGEAGFGL